MAGSLHAPPRIIRFSPSVSFQLHSLTLPARSKALAVRTRHPDVAVILELYQEKLRQSGQKAEAAGF